MHRARILVVARDPQTMSDVQDPRIANAHEIEIALHTEMALTILNERRMDLLVLDLTLTNGDDVATLKAFKRDFPNVSIIAIGNKRGKAITKKLKQAGADYYVVRPIESDTVAATVNRALSKAGVLV